MIISIRVTAGYKNELWGADSEVKVGFEILYLKNVYAVQHSGFDIGRLEYLILDIKTWDL